MKIYQKMIAGIAMLISLLPTPGKASGFHSYESRIHGITYRIDPRIELFNTVSMLFGHNGMSQSNLPYKQEILAHFTPFKQHPVVDSLLNTYKKGWGVDDPVFFMLCLNSNLELIEGLNEDQIHRGGGIERLKMLATLFKDFALKSDYYTWFNVTQRPFYQSVILETAYNFRNFHAVQMMENYFGVQQDGYFAILNLIGGYGNFGRAFTRKGKTELYAVIETRTTAGEKPVFAPGIALFTLLVHEFGHGFVNPAIDPHIAGMDQYASLYEPIKGAMQAAGYYSWRSTVYETIVPAVVVRVAEHAYGKAFAQKNFYKPLMGRRFIYADVLLEKLAWYEQHRNEYPDFKSFVPKLLSAFAQIDTVEIARLQKKVNAFRQPDVSRLPKPNEFAHDSTTYFIIGTHEPDKQSEAAMHAWVKKYHGMISPNSPIITDEEALSMDLSGHDLVLFGTPSGNSLLQRHIGLLPVTILPESMMTNRVINGAHLQLVTGWVNPYDHNKAMVIYTAQQTADIRNFESSPYKEQYGYWVAENTITLDQGDYVNYWKIWSCEPI